MLKYNYKIVRDEGNVTREYNPDLIPTELDNIVYIEGPNSSGKSTLLNILALGLFGLELKDNELHSSLKEKLENLLYSEHQKLQFNFEILSKDSSLCISSEKPDLNSAEFFVKIRRGKTETLIDPDRFKREFKLIYDVPINPLGRLPQLLNEIKFTQSFLGNKIASIR